VAESQSHRNLELQQIGSYNDREIPYDHLGGCGADVPDGGCPARGSLIAMVGYTVIAQQFEYGGECILGDVRQASGMGFPNIGGELDLLQ
jgi:hypothetical protein